MSNSSITTLGPKIAFGGPSGSGKTTLANFIKEQDPKIRQIQSFETREFSDNLKEHWRQMYNYQGDIGHRALINLQNEYPQFGREWQTAALMCRKKIICKDPHFVMDRSPLDNVVYMLTQTAHNMEPSHIKKFIGEAQKAYSELDHFILIKVNEQEEVEENNSRVSNIFYQRYISDVFFGVWGRYFQTITGPRVLILDTWDLTERKELLTTFLSK